MPSRQRPSPAPAPVDPDALMGEVARTGFATVPLLDPSEVGDLLASYHRLTDEHGFGCRPSTISPDPQYRRRAREAVRAALEPGVRRLLPDHECVVAAFVPKEPGPGSEMAFHQDWSTCDEDSWNPVEVWVPLTRTGTDDGSLALIPGSHRRAPARRGSGMDMVVTEATEWSAGSAVEVRVPVGSAIVFHPAIIHGSGPNRSTDLRLAVISTFQPVGAPTLHFSREQGQLVTYAVSPDFYISNPQAGEPVSGQVVSTRPW